MSTLTMPEAIEYIRRNSEEVSNGCWVPKHGQISKPVSLALPGGIVVRTASWLSLSIAAKTGEQWRARGVLHTCKNRFCVNPDHLYYKEGALASQLLR